MSISRSLEELVLYTRERVNNDTGREVEISLTVCRHEYGCMNKIGVGESID